VVAFLAAGLWLGLEHGVSFHAIILHLLLMVATDEETRAIGARAS